MERGITLMAVNHPTYGKFAYNLALSIKYHSPDLPIQLIHDDNALSHFQPAHYQIKTGKLFDILTPIDTADLYDNGRLSIGKAKMELYSYFAFDETIYLDVDSLVVRDIRYIFDKAETDYHTVTVGFKHLNDGNDNFSTMQWASVPDMIEAFGLDDTMTIPATNSSFQYWKRGEFCDSLYWKMNQNFSNKIPDDQLMMRWGRTKNFDGQPDELYLNVSLAQLHHDPTIKDPPLCFKQKKSLNPGKDYQKFSILSLYGGVGFTHPSMFAQYEREMRKISKEMTGRHHEFKINSLMKDKLVDN